MKTIRSAIFFVQSYETPHINYSSILPLPLWKEKRYNAIIRNLTSPDRKEPPMCGANIFPQILTRARIPKTLHAKTTENNSVTLGQIFTDRPESEFLHAVKILEQFEAGQPGSITCHTTIGELRATTRAKITEGTINLLTLAGKSAEKTKAFLDTYATANP